MWTELRRRLRTRDLLSRAFSFAFSKLTLTLEAIVVFRAPLIVIAALAVLLLLPAQSVEAIKAFAELAAQKPERRILFGLWRIPGEFETLLAAYFFYIMLIILCGELFWSQYSRSPASRLSQNMVIAAAVATAIALASLTSLRIALLRVAQGLRQASSASADSLDYAKAADYTESLVNRHYAWLAIVIMAATALRFFLIFSRRRTHVFVKGRRRLFFLVLPAFYVGLWIAQLFKLIWFPAFVGQHGSLHMLFHFFTGWLIIFSAATYWSDHYSVPIVTAFTVGIIAISVSGQLRDNYLFSRGSASIAAAPLPEVVSTNEVSEWIKLRREEARKRGEARVELLVVAAQGGGIYAAYHSAAVLLELLSRDPVKARRIFAVSSVSGGALGTAIASALVAQDRVAIALANQCGEHQRAWMRRREDVEKIFSDDYLSPILIAGLYADSLREIGLFAFLDRVGSMLGVKRRLGQIVPDRARALENAIERSMDGLYGKGSATTAAMRSPSLRSWSAQDELPALLFNVTTGERGHRLLIGPLNLITRRGQIQDTELVEDRRSLAGALAALNTSNLGAALLSARFPFITPPGILYLAQNGKVQRFSVVDGGYADNSGIATALEYVSLLRRAIAALEASERQAGGDNAETGAKLEMVVKLVVLTGESARQTDTRRWTELSSLVGGISGARQARVREYVEDAIKELGRERVIELAVQRRGDQLPLGWLLSRISKNNIRAQIDRDIAAHPELFPQVLATCSEQGVK